MPGVGHRWIPRLLLLPLCAALAPAAAAAQEGIAGDRLKLTVQLALAEKFHGNIYLESEKPNSDFVTTVSPSIGLELGISAEAGLKLEYAGDYSAYALAERFGKDSHRVGLTGAWLGAGGSTFSVGGRAKFDSIQPWSEQDDAKPFTDTEARADALLKTGTSTDLGFAYSRAAVRFSDDQYAGDQYVRQAASANILYTLFDPNVVFLGYTYLVLDADDDDVSGDDAAADAAAATPTGWRSHNLEIGLRWEPTHKLSGKLQGGYGITRFEQGEELTDLIVDTDLVYRVSEILSLKLAGTRQLGVSTSAARDFGDYYVSTAGRFFAVYRPWESFQATLGLSYENRTFTREGPAAGGTEARKPFGAGLSLKYAPRSWFSASAGYWHTRSASSIPTEEYAADIVEIRLTFSL